MKFRSLTLKQVSNRALEHVISPSQNGVNDGKNTLDSRSKLLESAQNLLKHIPGEASGFYLMAIDSFTAQPELKITGIIFVLSLTLLIVVRKLAGASNAIMITTIGAFLLWMLVLDKGFLALAFPSLLPDPLGLILAVFYSTLITTLAGAGKIE